MSKILWTLAAQALSLACEPSAALGQLGLLLPLSLPGKASCKQELKSFSVFPLLATRRFRKVLSMKTALMQALWWEPVTIWIASSVSANRCSLIRGTPWPHSCLRALPSSKSTATFCNKPMWLRQPGWPRVSREACKKEDAIKMPARVLWLWKIEDLVNNSILNYLNSPRIYAILCINRISIEYISSHSWEVLQTGHTTTPR